MRFLLWEFIGWVGGTGPRPRQSRCRLIGEFTERVVVVWLLAVTAGFRRVSAISLAPLITVE